MSMSSRRFNDYNSSSSSSSSSASSSPDRRSSSYDSTRTSAPASGSSSKHTQNVFANDGSFLEMFKKYQEKQQQTEQKIDKSSKTVSSSARGELTGAGGSTLSNKSGSAKTAVPAVLPIIGKRKGGKILPTGKVKKLKNPDDEDDDDEDGVRKPKDAWSIYMSEVKKYKETVCQGDEKTRPLVK